jgi:hypothetical protein
VSEQVLEGSPWIVAELAAKHSIVSIDAPLEVPLSLIVDGSTGCCLLPSGALLNQTHLKEFVRGLVKVCWKFETLWVVVCMTAEEEQFGNDGGAAYFIAMAGLFQSLSCFPRRVHVRECITAHLSSVLFSVCSAATHDATTTNDGCLLSAYLERAYLDRLQEPRGGQQFLAHCDFLQLFPTINFFTAAQILSVVSLQELAGSYPEAVIKRMHGRAAPEVDPLAIHALFELLSKHIGLVRLS